MVSSTVAYIMAATLAVLAILEVLGGRFLSTGAERKRAYALALAFTVFAIVWLALITFGVVRT